MGLHVQSSRQAVPDKWVFTRTLDLSRSQSKKQYYTLHVCEYEWTLKPCTQMSSIVLHMVRGKRANLIERTVPLCVWYRAGGVGRWGPVLSRHSSTQYRYSMALIPKPCEILLLPRFILESGKVLQSYILQLSFFLIMLSSFNLGHYPPRFGYIHVDILLCERSEWKVVRECYFIGEVWTNVMSLRWHEHFKYYLMSQTTIQRGQIWQSSKRVIS